jgi:multiple sugar transport system substrate-binding protein
MRLVFASVFAFLIVCTLWAVTHVPTAPVGKTVLTWVTDDAPVRQDQMRLFREFCRSKGRTDVDIRLDPNNGGLDKIVVQSVGGVGPDLFDMYQSDQLNAFVEAGILLDVTDAAKAQGFALDRVWPALKTAATIAGRQYSVPPNCASTAIFYNKDVFDRYGVPYPKGDWTWDQFVATARKLTVKRPNGRGYESFGIMGYTLTDSIWQAGGEFYTPDGSRCALDSPEAIAGAQFFANLQHKYHVMPTASEETAMSSSGGWGSGALNYFMGGHIAMIVSGRYAAINWRKVPGLRWGVAPLPYGKRHANRLLWKSTGINRNSPNAEAAHLFLQFLTTKALCENINSTSDGISAIPEHDYTDKYLHDPEHPDETDNALWLSVMKHSRDAQVSPFVNPFTVTRKLTDYTDLIRNGDLTPDEAMKRCAAEINTMIRNNVERDPVVRQRWLERNGKGQRQ